MKKCLKNYYNCRYHTHHVVCDVQSSSHRPTKRTGFSVTFGTGWSCVVMDNWHGHLLARTFISVCDQPPRPTQPSIPLGLLNEDQLRIGRKKAGMVHSVSGWTRGVQLKLWHPLRTCAIPERHRWVFMTRRYTNPRLPLLLNKSREFCCLVGCVTLISGNRWQFRGRDFARAYDDTNEILSRKMADAYHVESGRSGICSTNSASR